MPSYLTHFDADDEPLPVLSHALVEAGAPPKPGADAAASSARVPGALLLVCAGMFMTAAFVLALLLMA